MSRKGLKIKQYFRGASFLKGRFALRSGDFTLGSLRKASSLIFRFLICLQLVFIPQLSSSAPKSSPRFTNKEMVEDAAKILVQMHNDEIESLRSLIFSEGSKKVYQEHALDTFSLLGQTVKKGKKIEVPTPYFRYVNPEKIKIEITDESEKTIDSLDRNGKRIFKMDSNKNYSFKISYKDTVIHTFLHKIKWIALLDNYIVFSQPDHSSKKSPPISFIDLEYFSSALGKTTLPIFKIPFDSKSKKKQSFSIDLHETGLKINSKTITSEEFSFFSKLQQMAFSTMVSLVDPSTYSDVKPILKDMVNVYSESFEDSNSSLISSFNNEKKDSYETLKQFLQESLYLKEKTGAAQDVTGPYGIFLEATRELKKEEGREVMKKFSEHLDKDKAFQSALLDTFQTKELQQKMSQRLLIFLAQITSPRPLGAPKIRTALAMIANSANPMLNRGASEDSIRSRTELLKKGVKHFLSNGKTQIGLPILTGLGLGAAYPEIGAMLYQPLSVVGTWTSHFTEVMKVFAEGTTAFTNVSNLQETYISDGRWVQLAIGTGAVFGIILASLGSFHFVTNANHYIKNFTKSKTESFKNHFINYIYKEKEKFMQNLSSAELRKIGLNMDVVLSDGTIYKGLFRSHETWKHLLNNFLSDTSIKIHFKSKSGDRFPLLLRALKEGEVTDSEMVIIKIKVSEDEKIQREFVLNEGYLEDYFKYKKQPSEKNKKQISKEVEAEEEVKISDLRIEGTKFNISGDFLDADFSKAEEAYIRDILKEIKKEKKQKDTGHEEEFSKAEITTLGKAIAHLFLGYSSWSKTFGVLATGWNRFFIARSFVIRPFTSATLLINSNYYNRTYKQSHKPTKLNGGFGFSTSIIKDYLSLATTKNKRHSIKQDIKRLRDFEAQIIPVERQYLKAATEQAFIAIAKQSVTNPELLDALGSGVSYAPSKVLNKSKNKKHKLFFRAYQEELFNKAMLDYLEEHTGIKANATKIKKDFIKQLDREIELPKESLQEVRDRVQKIVQQNDIESEALATTKGPKTFFKRRKLIHDMKVENVLNPKKNLIMERFDVAEKGIADPEGMARVSRQQLSKLVIDKPIEYIILLLIYAGIDQGLLRILHSDMFSEEAFFHISRYAVWFGFFSNFTLDVFSGGWGKIQQDSRLDELGGFDSVPTEEDINKKFAKTRWFLKQLVSKDNSFLSNYLFSARVMISSIPAFAVVFFTLSMVALGRFDLDSFIGVYLVALLFGLPAVEYKFENAFEKSANFALKDLIKKGMDFNKNKKLLSHPLVQSHKSKELVKMRAVYNAKYSILFDNPSIFMQEALANLNTTLGTRALQRLFFGGHLMTDYIVGALDSIERAHLLPSSVTSSCKELFIKNRKDL